MKHLEGLNEAQKKATLATEGPLLVLAGAGAGKTRVIAARIAQIISKGTDPSQILAVTFTNKAAQEMRERVGKGPFISTFHSLGLTIIKENRKELGFKRGPVVYDRADSLREIKHALKQLSEDLEPRMVLGLISRRKGDGISATQFAEEARDPRQHAIATVWGVYESALHKAGALDFDDLLLRAAEFLARNAVARERYQKRWTYVLIDEYQDTNRIQARMAELLVGKEKNICAVGDIDQTIYTWRGAQIQNLLSFEKKFPGTEMITLEQNYRSTKTILQAANEIIVKNTLRPEKHLFTDNEVGEPLSLYFAMDETDEATFVARIVEEQVAQGKHPKDFAVLYRANFQSRAIEEALLARDIPYQVLGTRFFERKEVKDALAYIRAALFEMPADIARIANTPPRGIGKVTLLKLLTGQPAGEKVEIFKKILATIKAEATRRSPQELVKFVIEYSGMEEMYKEDRMEGAERLENLRELVTLAARHQNLEDFLESAALAQDQDELREEQDAVRLMTVHASKGLEFDTVFIVGLEEGLFPLSRDGEDEDPEEERRLMYVALTRAERKLYLSFAAYRTVFGQRNATVHSSFLEDIPGECMVQESPERLGKTIYLE